MKCEHGGELTMSQTSLFFRCVECGTPVSSGEVLMLILAKVARLEKAQIEMHGCFGVSEGAHLEHG